MGEIHSRFRLTKAILFDMHKTITDVSEGFITLSRKVADSVGVDLSKYTDYEILDAFERLNAWFSKYQIEHDVDIHFGNEVEHWIEANRIMFESLGIEGISDDVLILVEERWKELLKTWETPRQDAKDVLFTLFDRGYRLGICTRRPDDPHELLREWGILEILSTVKWTFVTGYAKPHPFTLILAANEIGVNPLRCAFVGNSIDADVFAAERAGMIPILTTWANPEEEEKAPDGTYVIKDISKLLEIFQGPTH